MKEISTLIAHYSAYYILNLKLKFKKILIDKLISFDLASLNYLKSKNRFFINLQFLEKYPTMRQAGF